MPEKTRFQVKTGAYKIIHVLHYCGLWPYTDFYKFDLYLIYAILVNVSFVAIHLAFQILSLTVVESVADVANFFYVGANELLIILKGLIFVKNLPKLKSLITALDADNFQPKNEQQIDIMAKMQNQSMSFYKINGTNAALAVSLWTLTPLLDGTYKEHQFPLVAWYPFNMERTPVYLITYIFQIFGTSFMATSVVNMNMFLFYMMMTVACQCDILSDNLTNLYEYTLKELNTDNELFDKKIEENVLKCIKHHKHIVRFAKDANDVFGPLILCQVASSIIMISTSLLRLTVIYYKSTGFLALIAYEIYALCEGGAYCYCGNEVFLKSSHIPMAAFLSRWIEFPRRAQRNLLMLMTRTNRCIYMTSFGFFNLTLEAYKKVLQSAWSYFVVLRQLQDEPMIEE